MLMLSRIGIVTGGGDCPGLNAAIRSAANAAIHRGWHAMPGDRMDALLQFSSHRRSSIKERRFNEARKLKRQRL